jgi:hypothetical protein
MVKGQQGLTRMSLKPTVEEVLEDLGNDLADAEVGAGGFEAALDCLDRYFAGDVNALDGIELDLGNAPPFFCRGMGSLPPDSSRRDPQLSMAGG